MKKEKICLAECIHYITGIDKQELVTAIYRQEKLGDWVDNVFNLINTNGYEIKRTEKSKLQCICILTKENTQLQHAIVLNKGHIELNPYCIDLGDYIPEYFFHLKGAKK